MRRSRGGGTPNRPQRGRSCGRVSSHNRNSTQQQQQQQQQQQWLSSSSRGNVNSTYTDGNVDTAGDEEMQARPLTQVNNQRPITLLPNPPLDIGQFIHHNINDPNSRRSYPDSNLEQFRITPSRVDPPRVDYPSHPPSFFPFTASEPPHNNNINGVSSPRATQYEPPYPTFRRGVPLYEAPPPPRPRSSPGKWNPRRRGGTSSSSSWQSSQSSNYNYPQHHGIYQMYLNQRPGESTDEVRRHPNEANAPPVPVIFNENVGYIAPHIARNVSQNAIHQQRSYLRSEVSSSPNISPNALVPRETIASPPPLPPSIYSYQYDSSSFNMNRGIPANSSAKLPTGNMPSKISEQGSVRMNILGRSEWLQSQQQEQQTQKVISRLSFSTSQSNTSPSNDVVPLTPTPPVSSSKQSQPSVQQARTSVSGDISEFLIPPQLPIHAGRVTCCLDLDDTLVHTFEKRPSWWDPVNNPRHLEFDVVNPGSNKDETNTTSASVTSRTQSSSSGVWGNITHHIRSNPPPPQPPRENWHENAIHVVMPPPQVTTRSREREKLYVCIRPYAMELVRAVLDNFEAVFFTTGTEDYAQPIFDHLDPERAAYRLYRSHCTEIGDQLYIKDLSRLGRPLDRVILLDDRGPNITFQSGNVLYCEPFINEAIDNAEFRERYDDDLSGYIYLLETLSKLSRERMLEAMREYQLEIFSRLETKATDILNPEGDSDVTTQSRRE